VPYKRIGKNFDLITSNNSSDALRPIFLSPSICRRSSTEQMTKKFHVVRVRGEKKYTENDELNWRVGPFCMAHSFRPLNSCFVLLCF